MGDSLKPLVIAVDGGGTRCRVAMDDGQSAITIETGPANVSTDFEGAIRQIGDGLSRLAQRTNQSVEALAQVPAFVGLAGVTGPKFADRLRAALPFVHVRTEDDRPAALRGALGREDGVIAHCGTGSFFAAQKDGQARFAGGWGPILGDLGSAQWLARIALRMTLESVDGFFPNSAFARRVLSDFHNPAGIVEFAGGAGPADFGALAPLVTEYAKSGDALALHVVRAGAAEIARTLRQIGWTKGQSICLTGGVGPQYAFYLPVDMQADLTEPAGEPLAGALSLARDLAREIADARV